MRTLQPSADRLVQQQHLDKLDALFHSLEPTDDDNRIIADDALGALGIQKLHNLDVDGEDSDGSFPLFFRPFPDMGNFKQLVACMNNTKCWWRSCQGDFYVEHPARLSSCNASDEAMYRSFWCLNVIGACFGGGVLQTATDWVHLR
jgi:hypothetical protein